MLAPLDVEVAGKVGVVSGEEELARPLDGDARRGERQAVEAAALGRVAAGHEAGHPQRGPAQPQSTKLHSGIR